MCSTATRSLAFDPALQHAREQAIFGSDTPAYGWHYPPFFLFIAAALALMPYGLALAVWQIGDPATVSADDSRDRDDLRARRRAQPRP